jgi:phage-related holin
MISTEILFFVFYEKTNIFEECGMKKVPVLGLLKSNVLIFFNENKK